MLREKYQKEVVPQLVEELSLKNNMAAPKIKKVVINTGFGKRTRDMTGKEKENWLSFVGEQLSLVTGQKPVFTRSHKSISGFDLQEGKRIGAKVVLRGQKMYDFLERLVRIGLPRSRDFRGIKRKSVDEAGNLTVGIRDHTIFPEVDVEKLQNSFGMEVTVVTDTRDRKEALRLFELLGFPLQK